MQRSGGRRGVVQRDMATTVPAASLAGRNGNEAEYETAPLQQTVRNREDEGQAETWLRDAEWNLRHADREAVRELRKAKRARAVKKAGTKLLSIAKVVLLAAKAMHTRINCGGRPRADRQEWREEAWRFGVGRFWKEDIGVERQAVRL